MIINFPVVVYSGSEKIIIATQDEWNQYSASYQYVEAAGGLVLNENGEVLMIYRRDCWDFPKGKVEVGETIREAAIREVEEETGLSSLQILRELSPTYHTYPLQEERILKKTYWYLMKSGKSESLRPQIEEEITDLKWVKSEEVEERLRNSFGSLRELWHNESCCFRIT